METKHIQSFTKIFVFQPIFKKSKFRTWSFIEDIELHFQFFLSRDNSRYLYKHAVLGENESVFNGQKIERDRRVSVIMRNEPDKNISER